MFLYCKIIISFSELFLVTCFLCILQTHLTRRNTSISTKLKKYQHMTFKWWQKWHLSIFFIKTYSILSIQYKISCKMDKNFLIYMFFHPLSLKFFWEMFWENTSQKYNNLWVAFQIWFNKSQNFRVKLYYTKFSA